MEISVTQTPDRPTKGYWRATALLSSLTLLVGLGMWFFTLSRPAAPANLPQAGRDLTSLSQPAFEEATGLRVTLVAVTGQGGLIDFRYQVIDPDKAVITHDPKRPPTLVDEATGQTYNTPWMQHPHSGDFTPGVTYYLVLVNPQGGIKPGSVVSVVIGDFRLEHVRVK